MLLEEKSRDIETHILSYSMDGTTHKMDAIRVECRHVGVSKVHGLRLRAGGLRLRDNLRG